MTIKLRLHCVKKRHYNFNRHQPILVILGKDVAEKACYRMLICYPLLLTNVFVLTGETWTRKLCLFSHTVAWKCHCFGLLYLRLS